MTSDHNKYQYTFDAEGLGGRPVSGWQNHRYDEGGVPAGLHYSDLFDQNEDESGERIDLVTGEPFDNSTYDGMENLRIVNPDVLRQRLESEDLLGPIID